MIGYLRGTLLSKEATQAIVETGGVGYLVNIPLSTFYELGEEGDGVELHVYTHVREDAIELFGFSAVGERGLFRRLIAISGIGPRLALAVIGSLGPAELLDAVENEDAARLVQVPGVGRKTADRLLLELGDKLVQLRSELEIEAVERAPAATLKADIVSALENLGYKRKDAERAAEKAVERAGVDADFGQVIRLALSNLMG